MDVPVFAVNPRSQTQQPFYEWRCSDSALLQATVLDIGPMYGYVSHGAPKAPGWRGQHREVWEQWGLGRGAQPLLWLCHHGDLHAWPFFKSVFCLSLPFSPLPPPPSVCGLITAQTFNSDGNWNNNTGRILLALLLQLASGSYE